MQRKWMLGFVFLLTVTARLLLPSALAQEKEFRGQDAQRVAAWLRVSSDHAADYRITLADADDKPLKRLPKAVFRHSQPVRGDDIGAVYLWVDEAGTPGAIGSVFAFTIDAPSRWVAHEFHSLASAPLTAKWRDQSPWAPAEAGLTWKELPDSSAVAADAEGRLRQMRAFSRRFAGHSTDPKDGRWELRLVTQPIYQYTVEKPKDILGGAIFVLCQGTDPEVVISLQARKTADATRWHYACAAFSDYGLNVALDGKEVWSQAKNSGSARNKAHWWSHQMEVKTLTAEQEAELAKPMPATN